MEILAPVKVVLDIETVQPPKEEWAALAGVDLATQDDLLEAGEAARQDKEFERAAFDGTFSRIVCIGMLAFSALSSVLALYLSAEFGITEKTIGYVFLYVGIFSVLMRSALIGPIVDRIGETWSIRAGAPLNRKRSPS